VKLDKEKIIEQIKRIEREIWFLFELSKGVDGFKLKPNLNPRKYLFDSSVCIREGREEIALRLLEECKRGIEATLTSFLRWSWLHFESRLKKLKYTKPLINKAILDEVVLVLAEEKECVTAGGKLDINRAVLLYGNATHVLRCAEREIRLEPKSSDIYGDSFPERWRRYSAAEKLCRAAEMFPW
jgi:hypothetical protein